MGKVVHVLAKYVIEWLSDFLIDKHAQTTPTLVTYHKEELKVNVTKIDRFDWKEKYFHEIFETTNQPYDSFYPFAENISLRNALRDRGVATFTERRNTFLGVVSKSEQLCKTAPWSNN